MLNYIYPKARARGGAQHGLEQALGAAEMPVHFESGRWAVLISLIALLLSGFSLYETVLKQAQPVLHVGAVMHYARDADGVEVFAVPITITNHGARDAVVTALDLRVSQAKPGAAAARFASVYVGAGSNPAKDKQPFTPLSIPGRGSYAGTVLFYPRDLRNRSPQVVAGEETYRFCVTARTELSRDYPRFLAALAASPSATSFVAELPWFAGRALDASQVIPLQIKDAKRHEVPRGTDDQGNGLECG
jgi:hypothetical protein